MSAQHLNEMLNAALETCEAHEAELAKLDSIAGDGDHGTGMVRGLRAAARASVSMDASCGDALIVAGDAFADAAGGASGALWGVLLRTCGTHLGDGPVTMQAVITALHAGLEALIETGKAHLGDKTLVDVLGPFVDGLEASSGRHASLREAWAATIPVARKAADETAQMIARTGRSAALGERSLGTVDPGARSMELILEAVSASLPEVT